MMSDAQFSELVVKVLGGEASVEERARLDDLIRSSPAHANTFDELQATWKIVAEIGPLCQALDSPAIEIPPEISAQLRRSVLESGEDSEDHALADQDSLAKSPTVRSDGGRNALNQSPQRPIDWPLIRFLRLRVGAWFERSPIGFSRTVAAVTLLLALASMGLWWSRGHTSWETSQGDIAAYLVLKHGESQIQRAGGKLAVKGCAPLESTDAVTLSADAVATLLTKTGEVEVSGPGRLFLRDVLQRKVGAPNRTQSLPTPSYLDGTMRETLFASETRLEHSGLLVATRGFHPIALYSPLGATGDALPVVRWRAEPGKRYNLAIIDEFGLKRTFVQLNAVMPPVKLAQVTGLAGRALSRPGLYRIIISESGHPLMATEYTFRTLEADKSERAQAAPERLLRACRLFYSQPGRTGDILEELLGLPASWAESELALRLKLALFGQLGYQEEFDATAAKLRKIHTAG